MTQDDAHRGDPEPPRPSPGGEGQRPPGPPPPPPGYGAAPGYGPPAGYPPPYGAPPAGYGMQPGYGPPGYGPPPGYGHLPAGYPRPTNTLAILALVMAFVFSPVGLALGLVARRQIRETGEEGDGLALAGIIVGGLGTAVIVLGFVLFLIALVSVGSGGFAP